MMTPRERFLAFVAGKPVDRAPYWFWAGAPRQSTFDAWRKQGLSEDQLAGWSQFVGEERAVGVWKIDLRPYPRFDVRVLEQKGDTKVWIDEMGVTRVDHVRPATPGFVTRTYLEFPVKDRDGFLEMTQRYNPLEPMRFLPQAAEAPSEDPATWRFDAADESIYLNKLERYNAGPDPVMLVVRGLFWTLRDWCGFEQLCMMFYDRPGLVHEMMDFWTDFIEKLYRPVLPVAKVDLVMVNEDMAYKHQSMISLEMMREFLIPRYTRLIRFFKSMNVDVVTMDSDGHVSQILETFVPAGLDGIEPMEIAAGNDPAEYFGKYPRLIGWGGNRQARAAFRQGPRPGGSAKAV